jgi:hypothetical protein
MTTIEKIKEYVFPLFDKTNSFNKIFTKFLDQINEFMIFVGMRYQEFTNNRREYLNIFISYWSEYNIFVTSAGDLITYIDCFL